MKIKDVVCAEGRTGFFFDDQRAIKKGVKSDGASFIGSAVTEGFNSVRQVGVYIYASDGRWANRIWRLCSCTILWGRSA